MLKTYINSLLIALVGAALLLAGCNPTEGPASPTPVPEPTPTNPPPTGTPGGTAAYPAFGHAADFSWIAGQVDVTRIQGGCTYIRYSEGEGGDQAFLGGVGWADALPALTAHGAIVVVFGHFAGPTEPHEQCPGRAFLVERVQDNTGAPGSETAPIRPGAPTPTALPSDNGIIVGTSVPGTGPVEGPPLRDLPTITPVPTTPLTPDANRIVTVTQGDSGRTVEMNLGDTLQLAIKEDGYTWTITLSDSSILVEDTTTTNLNGQQRYTALARGQITLTAVGQLPCHKVNPPCGAPMRGVTLEIIVR